MNPISLVLLVITVVVMASTSPTSNKIYYDVKDGPTLFEGFVKDHNKTYKDEADRQLHYEAFLKNLEKINELNAKDTSAVFGINKFADQTEEEKRNMRGFGTTKKQ